MIHIVDVGDEPDADLRPEAPSPPVVATGRDFDTPLARYWLDRASFTLTEGDCNDRRTIRVASIEQTVAELTSRGRQWPHAAAVCDDVLRCVNPAAPALHGAITESLAYSTLQSGPEFGRWLTERGPAAPQPSTDPTLSTRDGNGLRVTLNRPHRHNALNNDMRAALLDVLDVALLDPSVEQFTLDGSGPSFCSGGDLAEFGTFANPAEAHLARTRHHPALKLDALTARLGRRCVAEVHGHVAGSGLELAAFCGWVRARPDSVFRLPELSLGLIPGAGGTVSVTRRIGRWRTAYLVLTGQAIDATTAQDWGLIDEVGE